MKTITQAKTRIFVERKNPSHITLQLRSHPFTTPLTHELFSLIWPFYFVVQSPAQSSQTLSFVSLIVIWVILKATYGRVRLLNEFLKLSTEIMTVANQNRGKYEGEPMRVQANACRYPEARENVGGLALTGFGAHMIAFVFFFF